jgi:hypothetical protein
MYLIGYIAMNILIGCEFSGTVREAFRRRGFNAVSCDLLPTEIEGPHYQGDIFDILCEGWDVLIAHPPCTYLARSGLHWNNKKPGRAQKTEEGIKFFLDLVNSPIPFKALENPIGCLSTRYRKPDQIIQPWQFGHGETKATCLWLQGLPKLEPTNIVEGREQRLWKLPPSPTRSKERSRTFVGIAEAMANQWGKFLKEKAGY